MSKGNKYGTSRQHITSALYSGGSELPMSPDVASGLRPIIADRLQCVIDGIAASKLLRDELVSCGLSPALIAEGFKHHLEYMLR